ncbi:MAG: alpha/beta hydrolase [Oscillospiraceae bacterium]
MVKKIGKRILIISLALFAIIVLLLGICYINHRIQLKSEELIYTPIGHQVEVNGHKINVYSEGTGDTTLVFMSGGGTCSPVLDFKSLYSLLSDRYRIVVIEKAGYGFSDDSDVARDIDTVLSDTRQALTLSGISAPYILCPHSMSGIEALYWAQQYPQEVTAIIGLDMAVPSAYKEMSINISLQHLLSFAANIGVTRWIPNVAESDAIKFGTLTEEEKELYRAVFYRRTATTAMVNEAAAIKTSAEIVGNGDVVAAPVLMFTSNGSGGTGYEETTWRGFQKDFISSIPNGKLIELDCPHYVQDYEYFTIAAEIAAFIESIVS